MMKRKVIEKFTTWKGGGREARKEGKATHFCFSFFFCLVWFGFLFGFCLVLLSLMFASFCFVSFAASGR